tara:strand:- start:2287 stop:2763 length:477 start_codon:yes stop_codon:yes gene_type:complete
MGSASRLFDVSYTLEDLTRMLNHVIKHSNSQRISEFIAFQLMEKGDKEDAHLVKLLQGINTNIVYTEGQRILVNKTKLHSWLMTDELMIKNDLMFVKNETNYVIATIKEISVNRAKPYQVEYLTINIDDPSTKKTSYTWITTDNTFEIDDVTDFDNVK